MKRILLNAAMILLAGLSFAQYTPSQVQTPLDMFWLRKDVPSIRNGFTKLKLRTPESNGSFVTWYDFNATVNNGVITETGYSNINPSAPLEEDLRSTGTMTNNVYIAMVELNDDGSWVPYGRQTIHFDVSGKDSAWLNELYNDGEYYGVNRTTIKYNENGLFAGYSTEQYNAENDEWIEVLIRNVSYTASQRSTDTVYVSFQGATIPFGYIDYQYTSGRLDSISLSGINTNTGNYEFVQAMKITSGVDGGADQVLTYTYQDSIVLESRAEFTGGSVGLNKLDENMFEIYPVPSNNVLNINVKDFGMYKAVMFDMQGRKVIEQTVVANTSINTAQLNNGIYILELEHEGAKLQKKIVIGH